MSTPTTSKNNSKPPAEEEEWVDNGERRPIPHPAERWLIGNVADMDMETPILSFRQFARLYGAIYKVQLKISLIIISSQKLVHYVCNEDKFEKVLPGALKEVRNFAGDGLFTSYTYEHNWQLAHRILIPAFGPLAIRKMQGMMMEIISQMLVNWEVHAGTPFEAADMYTRLTFDTIGWCAFRYRFNSFFTEKLHPFVDLMVKLLTESGHRSMRPSFVQAMMFKSEADYQEEIKELHKMCDDIVAQRRSNPDPDAHDLLNNMILDKDPKTGEQLSDENIRYQMVTFLIAGHETTSGMLSFATYYMLKNPQTYMKARAEADKAIAEAGGNLLKINPASLTYIDAICKETLRLQPTAPAWTVAAKNEKGEVLPGGYHVNKGDPIVILLHELHRDPAAWGDDAEEFRPERFLERPVPKDAWKPFGNGARACIGRGFALQEAHLALALITARFDLEMADPAYDLEIRQSLTVKPADFKIIAHPRKDRHQSLLAELIAGGTATSGDAKPKGDAAAKAAPSAPEGSAGKLYVLYGSNSGSCEGLANEIASEGSAKGFSVTLSDIDGMAAGGKLPTDGPVVICTASYEGKPTDDARMFVGAIENAEDKELAKGVKYCVMGAGHHDWETTFHKIPTLIDNKLAELGGERIMELHKADAGGDMVGDMDAFKTDLWEHFGAKDLPSGDQKKGKVSSAGKDGGKEAVPVRILPYSTNATANMISAGIDGIGKVVSQDVLVTVSDSRPQMNSIVIDLPKTQTYRAGDYLAVLAKNPPSSIERCLSHFDIKPDDRIVLNIPGSSFLPSDVPVLASSIVGEYVELGQPVSKRLLPKLVEHCTDGKEKEEIKALEENYQTEILDKRVSLLDLLERFKSCKAPFDLFLANLPKMKIRQYSISSTPLANPSQVMLTYTVHTIPDPEGGKPIPAGVASNYLAFLKPEDSVFCAVKASSEFHLPQDPSVPIIMFAAGSGFAPFRGFIQERALQKEAGRNVGPTVLYYGFRTPDEMLHKDELVKWVKEGVLDLRPVLSRSKVEEIADTKCVAGCKYVQHRVWEEREDIAKLFEAGAQLYTCGSGAKLGADLKKTLIAIIKEKIEEEGSDADPVETYENLAKDRYRTDVFL